MSGIVVSKIGPNSHVNRISQLYRLASFRGQLPEEDNLLERVSRYLNGDEKREEVLLLWKGLVDL